MTGIAVTVLLLIQFCLGVANVLFVIPIAVAVAHNGGASLLLASMGTLLFFSRHPEPSGTGQ
jgi:cytochrome c oxidase assembly protein subunit 15